MLLCVSFLASEPGSRSIHACEWTVRAKVAPACCIARKEYSVRKIENFAMLLRHGCACAYYGIQVGYSVRHTEHKQLK